jgi:beta-glucuronidase
MKKYHYILLLVLLTLSIHVNAQTNVIQNIASRKSLSLNGRWNYIIDPYEMGYYDYRHEPFDQSKSGKGGFYDDRKQVEKSELIEYNFDLSPTLNIPGDWNSQVEKLEFYEGTIWLRKKFSYKPNKNKKYVLYFGAVNYEVHVYLNGKKLGTHKGGFTPFQFDISDKLVNGENFVVVKADNTRKQDEIPTINTDWWNYGGITRDVFIAELPLSYIADYKVQLAIGNQSKIEGYVQLNTSNANQEITINIPEANLTAKLKTTENGRANFSFTSKKLSLWSPTNPKLYEVVISTTDETVNDKIGFRTIQTQGQDILLNGKSIFLRGISLHEENPLIPGRLRNSGDMRMMLNWAKELNCNYVRLAHYPHNEEMIRLADEMGLLVWAEVPVYWTISWNNPATYQNAEQQLSDLVKRDKNRASVIIWSVGNETPLSDARFNFMSKLVAKVRELDNTRLVSAALELHHNGFSVVVDDPLGELLDLVSFNQYGGWYWAKPKELPQYSFNIKYNKPVVISEVGGGALAGYHADDETRWSEEYQESLYQYQIPFMNTIKGLRGITPWILTDFKSPRRQHPNFQDFWNRKGLISQGGEKKKAFFVLKKYYQEVEKKFE